jgi:hypothetical protein
LVDAVHQVIEWLNRIEGGPAQIPRAIPVARSIIHYRDKPPIVPVVIQFTPPQAIGNAKLVLERIKPPPPPPWQLIREHQATNWEPEQVEAGVYYLHAIFQPQHYENLDEMLVVIPPGPLDEPIPAKEIQWPA